MLNAEMRKKIEEIVEEFEFDYEKIAIRVQDVPFSMGPIDHCSHVWVDGEETEDTLDGVCGQDVNTIDRYNNVYYGEHVAIIAGNDYTYGEDAGEVIISDAVVIAILA